MAEPPRQKHASAITGDSGPATGFQDLLPIPAENPNDARDGEAAREGAPSLSHALAGDDHDTKGFAQLDHDSEVRDLGWNEPKQDIAAPLVGGMDNEELWLLLRRFDKVGTDTFIFSHPYIHHRTRLTTTSYSPRSKSTTSRRSGTPSPVDSTSTRPTMKSSPQTRCAPTSNAYT